MRQHLVIAWIFLCLFYGGIIFFGVKKVRRILRALRNETLTVLDQRLLRRELWSMASGIIFTCSFIAVLCLMVLYSKHSQAILQGIVAQLGPRAQIVAAVVALGLGGAAYWFKRVDQYRYGFVEVAFGAIGGGVV